jgi:trimeric autotransporter adhesin
MNPSTARVSQLRRGIAAFLSLTLLLAIAACGSGSSSSTAPRTLSSLAITPANPSVVIGSTMQLTATGTYSDGATANLTSSVSWTSSDSTVETVSSSGLVTGVGLGTAMVTASSGSVSTHTNLPVNPALVSIAVTPATPSILVNGIQQFTATGTYSDSSQQDITGTVTWSSSDTSVASVNGAGLATGVAAGNATIHATSGSVSGSATLTINPILVSLTVTAADPIIDINTTTQFTAIGHLSDGSAQDYTQLVSWSAPGSVASIDNTGLATGLAVGTVTVTANYGSISGGASLQVTAPTLLSILVTPDNASVPLGIGQAFTATGVFSNGDTQDLAAAVWTSSDPTSVPIDSSGLAQTLAQGAVTISATYGSVTGSTTFTVLPAALASISLNPSNPSIALGTTVQLTPVGTFTDGSTQTLTSVLWNSDDPTVAFVAVNGNGTVSGNAIGSANVSATSGSITGSTPVTVTQAVISSIAVTPSTATIPAGLTQQFTAMATFTDTSTQDVSTQATWTSSSGSVATVSSSGLATAVTTGSSTITATMGSVSGGASLNVGQAILQSITLSPQNATMGKGTVLQFTATGNYSDNSTQDVTALVTWTSSDSTEVSIDNTGLATGRQFGTVTITAALGSINSSTSLIVNKNPLVGIVITPVNPTISVGQTQQFTATGHYSDGSTQDLTKTAHWSSSSSGVATINNGISGGGLATGKGVGSTTITASFQGVSDTTTLTVN